MAKRAFRLEQKFRLVFIHFLSLFLFSCIDPVEPDFEFRAGIVFVEGLVSTLPGASYVTISESTTEFNLFKVISVEGAEVLFKNGGTGATIPLIERSGVYVPPGDFAAAVGETWVLEIKLNTGVTYGSTPEEILEPVAIKELTVEYDPELVFNEGRNIFVPGHSIKVSFDDPAAMENNYYWTYRAYENLDFCERCENGIFRDGECQRNPPNSGRADFYDYACETKCWRIRFPEGVAIFNDRLSDGKAINALPVGDLLLYNKEDVVVEVQQFSLSPAAYKYYKVLKDIIDNSNGLNAPPPAALIGNISNLEDQEDFVFGRFTAAATASQAVFIDRRAIQEQPLERQETPNFEGFFDPVPAPETITAPCSETKFRTSIMPDGWIRQ
jgi:hypothetical protein